MTGICGSLLHHGVTVGFRCRDDEILVEELSPRQFVLEPLCSHLGALAEPGRNAEVSPPTTDPASAESAEIYATSIHQL